MSAACSLYETFGVAKDASQDQIKRAYYKMCLKYHPDKLTDKSEEEMKEATEKFQEINLWYSILSDPRKRKRYDETGEIEEAASFESNTEADWSLYFKELWTGIVSEETIAEFEKEYKESEEEINDLLSAYVEFEGNMDDIMDNVMLSTWEDEDRFISIIKRAIKDKKVENYAKFKSTTTAKARKKRREMAEGEAAEAEELKRDMMNLKNDENSLALLIAQRQNQRMASIIDSLEGKYTSGRGKKRKEMEKGPSEEEFRAIQERLNKKKN